MTTRWPGYLIGGLLAVGVPLVALLLTAGTEQAALDLMVTPFVWPRLAVVHLLTVLPLAFLIAALVPRVKPNFAWVWALVGLLLGAVTIHFGAGIATRLGLPQAGYWAGLATRCDWCLILELPWCLLGLSVCQAAPFPARWPALVLAAIFSTAVPWGYSEQLMERQAAQAAEALKNGRLGPALKTVAALEELGSSKKIAGLPPNAKRRELQKSIREFEAAVERPLPEGTGPAARVKRAKLLTNLARYAEAQETLAPLLRGPLEPLPPTKPKGIRKPPELASAQLDALRLLAFIEQEQGHWHQSDAEYRRALELAAAAPENDPTAIAIRKAAYSGLAFNAQKLDQRAEAETLYKEALVKVPSERAHFHFLLGKLYDRLRPNDAIYHLKLAARGDPLQYGAAAEKQIGILGQDTAGCMLPQR